MRKNSSCSIGPNDCEQEKMERWLWKSTGDNGSIFSAGLAVFIKFISRENDSRESNKEKVQ